MSLFHRGRCHYAAAPAHPPGIWLLLPFMLLAAVVLPCMPALAGPLETARLLADTKFKDFTYGSNAAKKQVDCVQFILAVVEEELKMTVGPASRNAILISHGWTAADTQLKAAAGTDPLLAGVQHALVTMNRGKAVPPAEAQTGDLIQYWMKKSDGSWFGHSGIIISVSNGKAVLFSASQSAGKIDEKPTIDLNGANRLIYIVRIIPP